MSAFLRELGMEREEIGLSDKGLCPEVLESMEWRAKKEKKNLLETLVNASMTFMHVGKVNCFL